jgi:hypothetical protein
MRDLRIVAVLLGAVVATTSLAFAFCPQTQIQTTIDINATPAQVWAVLADTSDYGKWNPEISALKGELVPGATLENHIGYGSKEMVFHPTVLVALPGHELRWLGHVGFPRIFDAEHYFLIQGDGAVTHFTQGEYLRGVALWVYDTAALKPGFEAMNRALKARVEAATPPHG